LKLEFADSSAKQDLYRQIDRLTSADPMKGRP